MNKHILVYSDQKVENADKLYKAAGIPCDTSEYGAKALIDMEFAFGNFPLGGPKVALIATFPSKVFLKSGRALSTSARISKQPCSSTVCERLAG